MILLSLSTLSKTFIPPTLLTLLNVDKSSTNITSDTISNIWLLNADRKESLSSPFEGKMLASHWSDRKVANKNSLPLHLWILSFFTAKIQVVRPCLSKVVRISKRIRNRVIRNGIKVFKSKADILRYVVASKDKKTVLIYQ